MKLKFILALLIGSAVFSGCKSDEELAKEKAAIEGKVNSEKQVEAENENLKKKVDAMEADLARRHRFYQALEGTYEGQYRPGNGDLSNIRFVFVPTVVPFQGGRTRTLAEVETDLNNLSFMVNVTEAEIFKSHTFENVRPNYSKGKIYLGSENCDRFYTLYISEQLAENLNRFNEPLPDESRLQQLSEIILDGKITSVPMLRGLLQPGKSSERYLIVVEKKPHSRTVRPPVVSEVSLLLGVL